MNRDKGALSICSVSGCNWSGTHRASIGGTRAGILETSFREETKPTCLVSKPLVGLECAD